MNDSDSSSNMENHTEPVKSDRPLQIPPPLTLTPPSSGQTLKLTPPPSSASPSSGQTLKLTPPPSQTPSSTVPPPPPPPSMINKPLPPPIVSSDGPVLTNVSPAADKRPLVFSDRNPLPHRDVETEKKPSAKVAPCPRPSKALHLDRKDFSEDASFGDLLRAARETAGLSVDQVAQITKLRSYYIHAMENAQMDRLPPPVYVAAYIRNLCILYKLDAESAEFVQEKRGALPREQNDVPQTLIQSLEKDSLVNEEENRKIRKIFYIVAAILLLLSAFIVWAIVAAVRAASAAPEITPDTTELAEPADKPVLTMEEFDSLTAPQYPEASSLEMSRTPSVAR